MARMSNRDRIAHAAAEARAVEKDKVAKKAVKKPAKRAKRASAKQPRMKILWAIYNSAGKPVATFPYPEEAAATSEALQLSSSTGQAHEVRALKVPMED